MKPTVTIQSIDAKYILEVEEHQYILEHLNEPLALAGLWFDHKGKLDHVTLRAENSKVITLFTNNHVKGVFSNGIEFQLG